MAKTKQIPRSASRNYAMLKEQAEQLFMEGMTGREIAEILSISEQTISKWRTEEDWDNHRKTLELTPVKLKQQLLDEAGRIVRGEKPTFNSDALSKIMAAIDRLDKSLNPRTIMGSLMLFNEWMSKNAPEQAADFLKWQKQFLVEYTSI